MFCASRTVAASGVANANPTDADCEAPLVARIDTGAPVRLVKENTAGTGTPSALAVTVKAPARPLAVGVTPAVPEESVVAVAAESVADAPAADATKVTATPGTGLPAESFTTTCRGEPKAVVTDADCGVPLVAVIVADAPAVLVRLNVTGEPTPDAAALTV